MGAKREAETYAEALISQSARVWPGCKGDGACRPCGRIHNYERIQYVGPNMETRRYPDFRCLENNERGCPTPLPEPSHDVPKGKRKCQKCGAWPKKSAEGKMHGR